MCKKLCFMHLIQKSLDEFATEWKGHRIRASRNTRVPTGIPDQLFFLRLYASSIYLTEISSHLFIQVTLLINIQKPRCSSTLGIPRSSTVHNASEKH